LKPKPSPRRTIAIADPRLERVLHFGPGRFLMIAGPCAVETRKQLMATARAVAAAGADLLRGGAFKPRTRPDSFQGLGKQGLELLSEASQETGLPIVTEVLDPRDVELVSRHAALLQIGSRNMQNFALLREVGRSGMPVLLKRGPAATLAEFTAAADYVLAEGNERIILCERGVRGFEPTVRYTLDLSAVPILQQTTRFPIVVDPSHATGRRDLVHSMALAAVGAGADGLMVEVHPDPKRALSDGPQALRLPDFVALMADLRRWIPLTGRRMSTVSEVRSRVRSEELRPVKVASEKVASEKVTSERTRARAE